MCNKKIAKLVPITDKVKCTLCQYLNIIFNETAKTGIIRLVINSIMTHSATSKMLLENGQNGNGFVQLTHLKEYQMKNFLSTILIIIHNLILHINLCLLPWSCHPILITKLKNVVQFTTIGELVLESLKLSW